MITSSYKTTLPLLKEYLDVADEQAFNIMQMTTDLAIQARDEALKEERASGELIVAASIGPYGVEEFIYPYVDYG